MKSLNSIKNNFRSNEILSNASSFRLKGGADNNNDSTAGNNNDDINGGVTVVVSLIGEPWDKRTPRPGTKSK